MLHNTSFRMIIVLLHFYTNTKMHLLKSYTYDGIAPKIYTTVQFSGDEIHTIVSYRMNYMYDCVRSCSGHRNDYGDTV